MSAIETPAPLIRKSKIPVGKVARTLVAFLVVGLLGWRMFDVIFVNAAYGADTWTRFAISGLIIGGMYALIAIGYTLVYGILFMINFAHGEMMMIGCFSGYFVFEILRYLPSGSNPEISFMNAFPVLAIVIAFLVGMTISAVSGFFLEKLAYRPLRKAPRLVPLISAIGASMFLQNAAQLLFGPQRRQYENPELFMRGTGWELPVGGTTVMVTYTGVLSFVLSVLLMMALFWLVQKTRLGKSMRAVAENKSAAALMGINVNGVISKTFIISGALAGAAGIMWGIHNGLVNHYIGFLPGIKAFTAAVMGGIGNIPGAMVGGMLLGVMESLGPAALGIDFQLKDVIAFTILILVLIFRPSGLLGERLSEEKL